MHHRSPLAELPLISPPQERDTIHTDARAAVEDLQARYRAATGFLREHFARVMAGQAPEGRFRAFYPSVSLTTSSFAKVDSRLSFAANPLYAVLHESIYCQHEASSWSAERTRSEFAQFEPGADQVMLTGEMIYPFVFYDDPALLPLRDVAHVLAAKDDWPDLYDESRLAANEVPVAAAIYHDDMYVDYGVSLQTAKSVNNVRYWITNEHQHDGLRNSPEVLDRLIKMVRGEV